MRRYILLSWWFLVFMNPDGQVLSQNMGPYADYKQCESERKELTTFLRNPYYNGKTSYRLFNCRSDQLINGESEEKPFKKKLGQ